MPSPTCQVKDGAGAYQATTNGVNVTPTNPVTISLVSQSGVTSWSISCIGTDELSSASSVTSGLVIDNVNKTATFTAPAAGRAYIFQSKVNNGVDINGTAQASYTTTFGVYTLTSGSLRVHAVNETLESNATFGWVGDFNSLLRAGGGVTVPISEVNGGFGADVSAQTGIPKNTAGAFSFVTAPTGTIVGTSDSQTLTNKVINGANNTLTARIASDVSGLGTGVATMLGTFSSANIASACTDETGSGALVFGTSPTISAPTLSSTPTLSGASTSTSNDAKGTATDVNPVHVQTTDATVTTLDSFTLASNTAVVVSWLVCAVKSDVSQAAAYSVTACFKNNAGTVAQVGTTTTTVIGESDAAWDATADNSTTTIRLRITGKAATTIQWTSILTKLTVIP